MVGWGVSWGGGAEGNGGGELIGLFSGGGPISGELGIGLGAVNGGGRWEGETLSQVATRMCLSAYGALFFQSAIR